MEAKRIKAMPLDWLLRLVEMMGKVAVSGVEWRGIEAYLRMY